MAFIDNPNNLPFINHKDEDPSNNNYLNLEWCDYQYNNTYGTCQERGHEKLRIPVLKIDNATNTVVGSYSSYKEAADANNLSVAAVHQSVHRRNHTGKYYYTQRSNE